MYLRILNEENTIPAPHYTFGRRVMQLVSPKYRPSDEPRFDIPNDIDYFDSTGKQLTYSDIAKIDPKSPETFYYNFKYHPLKKLNKIDAGNLTYDTNLLRKNKPNMYRMTANSKSGIDIDTSLDVICPQSTEDYQKYGDEYWVKIKNREGLKNFEKLLKSGELKGDDYNLTAGTTLSPNLQKELGIKSDDEENAYINKIVTKYTKSKYDKKNPDLYIGYEPTLRMKLRNLLWNDRSTLGKASIVGGGILAGTTAIGGLYYYLSDYSKSSEALQDKELVNSILSLDPSSDNYKDQFDTYIHQIKSKGTEDLSKLITVITDAGIKDNPKIKFALIKANIPNVELLYPDVNTDTSTLDYPEDQSFFTRLGNMGASLYKTLKDHPIPTIALTTGGLLGAYYLYKKWKNKKLNNRDIEKAKEINALSEAIVESLYGTFTW